MANCVFRPMLTDGAHIVPVAPELATPQLLLDSGDSCKDFARRETLDDSHDLSRTVGRYGLHEKMYVIPIRPNFDEADLIALGDFQAYGFQDLIDFFTEHDSPIFRWAHDVV